MKKSPLLRRPILAYTLLSLSSLLPDLHAQAVLEIEPTYISVPDGLVSPNVQDVMQDSYGLIWIATTNGIQKYDGYRFETFKNAATKPNSLGNNGVWDLLEDADHNIWVATAIGVSKYDRKKNEFKNYFFGDNLHVSAGGGLTFNLFVDSQKRLWATTQNVEVVQYNPQKDEWESAKYTGQNVLSLYHNGSVFGIAEDSKGGLWIGSTTYGLMHRAKNEDGFKPISAELFGSISFTKVDNTITALYIDQSNMLWITTRNGVYKYNPDSRSLKTIVEYKEAQLDNWNNWNNIHPDQEGNIWIANNFRGILKFKGISDQYEELSIRDKVKIKGHGLGITFTDFMIDRSGIFWFGSREYGLMKYDPVSKPFVVYTHNDADPMTISPNGVYGILASKVKPGIVYVGTRGGGINIFDPKKQTFQKVQFKVEDDRFGGSVRSIAEEKDGTVWLGTWGDGLIRLDKNYQEAARYKHDPKNTKSISDNLVRVLKTAKDGKIWAGTSNGLNILDPSTGNFERFLSKNSRRYTSSLTNEIDQLIKTEQAIGLIDQVTESQNRSLSVEIKEAGKFLVISVGEGDRISMADYGWIENASSDTVWLAGNYQHSFYAGGADKNRIAVEQLTLQPGTYTLHYVTDDSHNFGNWNEAPAEQTSLYGMVLIRLESEIQAEHFQTLLTPDPNEMLITGSNISDIEFGQEYIWVSAQGSGLSQIDPTNRKVNHFVSDPQNLNSISSNVVVDIFEDSAKMIWLATNDGLNKFDPATEKIIRYAETDGLPTNLVSCVIQGDNGEMWIATQNGLSQMITNDALGKPTFINYNSTDGLGGDSFLPLTSTRSSDGSFYFGGDHGLTTFQHITANKTPPAVIISNLLISNKSVLEKSDDSPLKGSLLEAKSISLPYNQNNVSFEFSALHYANAKKNQYAHMLKGYDKDWIYDNRNFASYTNLDPGEYDFIVRASNAYGIWNEEGKSIHISISPPWWRSWFAYAAYAGVFAFAGFTGDRLLRRNIRLREQEKSREKELEQAREIEKAYTNLKATQAQLVQSEKMASLGELTAGIAHEIQNPLNFINNFSEVSKELLDEMKTELDKGNTEGAKDIARDVIQNLEKINHHGKRADGIVKGMLQHSRISSGVKEPTDINALADEYLRLAYHGLRAKDKSFNATMKTDFDPTLEKVNIIPQDIGRVVLNLLTNAFYGVNEKKRQDSNGYQPTVSVSTKQKGNKVEIRVTDNGNGIPQKVLDKIFQPFFTTKPTGQGTGLGLSLSYDIVTNGHGGELKVETIENEGSTFVIVLPYS